jgi:hypothetical protein
MAAPSPSTMWEPTVYARAATLSADRAASGPLWTRTWPKSYPSSGSIFALDSAGSGCPEELRTRFTIEGAAVGGAPDGALNRWSVPEWPSSWLMPHPEDVQLWPPQRCRTGLLCARRRPRAAGPRGTAEGLSADGPFVERGTAGSRARAGGAGAPRSTSEETTGVARLSTGIALTVPRVQPLSHPAVTQARPSGLETAGAPSRSHLRGVADQRCVAPGQ